MLIAAAGSHSLVTSGVRGLKRSQRVTVTSCTGPAGDSMRMLKPVSSLPRSERSQIVVSETTLDHRPLAGVAEGRCRRPCLLGQPGRREAALKLLGPGDQEPS